MCRVDKLASITPFYHKLKLKIQKPRTQIETGIFKRILELCDNHYFQDKSCGPYVTKVKFRRDGAHTKIKTQKVGAHMLSKFSIILTPFLTISQRCTRVGILIVATHLWNPSKMEQG